MKNQITNSLGTISTGYSVFERDQVLTHDQLNSIPDYLDDQSRLSRIHLSGVGIVCGLRVALSDKGISVGRGAGITTDGDLAGFPRETRFDRFKPYDESDPLYARFLVDGRLIDLFELIPAGIADARAKTLADFQAATGRALEKMTALCFVESVLGDDDLCTATDCDNLGREYRATCKVLLVDQANAAMLLENSMTTPARACAGLEEIVLTRAVLGTTTTTTGTVAGKYRTACAALHKSLLEQFEVFFPRCSPFLGKRLPGNPASAWKNGLAAIKALFAGNDTGIQYYYDFLKDLAATWNDILGLLGADTTWCCPDPADFPKHLLLGDLADGGSNRTGWYPSPAVSRTAAHLDHTIFLLGKIDTLILSFQVPKADDGTVRVTPSLSAGDPLEERAIPCYYRIDEKQPVQAWWNFRLHRHDRGNANYAYRAAKVADKNAYAGLGAAAEPLAASIDGFSFFRVEGHLGRKADLVLTELEKLIGDYNLPFCVVAVQLGTDRKKVIRRPGIRYTDLHRFHYLLRQDLANQLDETGVFSGKFLEKMDSALPEKDGETLKGLASQKHTVVTARSKSARDKVKRGYSQYRTDPSWKNDLSDTLQAAGEYKFNAGKVVKTEFTTPFDSLISLSHGHWLDWLDVILDRKEDKADDRLLFANFVREHPGLEHLAGVARGGTFILGHDQAGTIVADFALPYCCRDGSEEEEEEPALTKPAFRPPFLIEEGIRVLPSIDRRLDMFQMQIEPIWQEKFDIKNNFFATFKESVSMMGEVYANVGKTSATGAAAGYMDKYLDMMARAAGAQKEMVEYYTARAKDPATPAEERTAAAEKARQAEEAVAGIVKETAVYVVSENKPVAVGSEGYKAMMAMSDSMTAVSTPATRTRMQQELQVAADKVAGNDGLKTVLNVMAKAR
ncbi:MAG: hypothetical protein AB1568_13250 [Thermodesulfobacteriota bacterium]